MVLIYSCFDEKGKRGYSFEKKEESPFLEFDERERVVKLGSFYRNASFLYEPVAQEAVESKLVERLGKKSLDDLVASAQNVAEKMNSELSKKPWLKEYNSTLRFNLSSLVGVILGSSLVVLGTASFYLLTKPKQPETLAFIFPGLCLGLGLGIVITRLKEALEYRKAAKVIRKELPAIKKMIDSEFTYRRLKWKGEEYVKLLL